MMKLFFAIMMTTFTAGVVFGEVGLWVTAVSATILFLLWFVMRHALVRIPEMAVGVVYHAESQRFLRFLPPGHHWMMPFVEKLAEPISTAPATLQGFSKGIQASGGILLNITWSLSYSLNPLRIAPEKAAKLARTLPRKTAVLATRHLDNIFQHIIGDLAITELTQPGAHKRLERQVRQQAAARLAPLGFEVSLVMIGAIELPTPVQTALEAAQERRLHAENEAFALAQLQRVVSQFSESDMQRLMELERIHHLGQNGVTLLYSAGYEAQSAPPLRRRTSPFTQPFVIPAQ
ncbi:MAG: SPFH domain-containing protein [Ardenticatenaceae bacterium]|nr:SPFH domain-containing protein [Anaerolineales bacterium]MCB8923628.1 SPFH domain-containing protein [Ardenticatenaceae bacterium]MCB8991847.1 SPFH domain-containing protein [Ardenticatenaceae bacterium]MCB9005134.1 SPFH domain-containing protein [Ardenticatenaceae bacterium]